MSHKRMFLMVASFLSQVLQGQRLVRRELPLLDVVQAIGQARVADVEVDVRLLLDDLVRRHLVPLNHARVHDPAQDRDGDQRRDAPRSGRQRPEADRDQAQDGEKPAKTSRAFRMGSWALTSVYPAPKATPRWEKRRSNMARRYPIAFKGAGGRARTRRCPRARRVDREASGEIPILGYRVDGDGGQAREEQDPHQPAIEGVPERELKHVESHIPVEEWVPDAERRGIQGLQDQLPSARPHPADEEGQQRAHGQGQPANVGRQDLWAGQPEGVLRPRPRHRAERAAMPGAHLSTGSGRTRQP